MRSRGRRRRSWPGRLLRPLAAATLLTALCAAALAPARTPNLALASTATLELQPLTLTEFPEPPFPVVRTAVSARARAGASAAADQFLSLADARARRDGVIAAAESALPDVLEGEVAPARPIGGTPRGLSGGVSGAGGDARDIPPVVLSAYHNASRRIGGVVPGCVVPWSVLAGIGRVESGHGRHGGATAAPDGMVSPRITGQALTGAGDTAQIRDSDGGAWDGDAVWDRAVGPMQFIPTSWRAYGRDGNDDGAANPNNIFDAALGAAVHLCRSAPGDLRNPDLLRRAIYGYNHSLEYVATVTAWINRYEGSTSGTLAPVVPSSSPNTQPALVSPRPATTPPPPPAPLPPPPPPSPSPSPSPSEPSPSPSPSEPAPSPSPSPSEPAPSPSPSPSEPAPSPSPSPSEPAPSPSPSPSEPSPTPSPTPTPSPSPTSAEFSTSTSGDPSGFPDACGPDAVAAVLSALAADIAAGDEDAVAAQLALTPHPRALATALVEAYGPKGATSLAEGVMAYAAGEPDVDLTLVAATGDTAATGTFGCAEGAITTLSA